MLGDDDDAGDGKQTKERTAYYANIETTASCLVRTGNRRRCGCEEVARAWLPRDEIALFRFGTLCFLGIEC